MLEVGQRIASYRIVRSLGEGGMGAVHEALHELIGRRAAIKVLHPHLSQDPQFVARFLTEARAVNQVRHPGLVEVFEFGTLPDGTAYLVMEYLAGESLSQRMAYPGWRWRPEDLDLVRQVALALQAVHDQGIIHRDLKPDNLMVVPDLGHPGRYRAKVLDFGVAKMTDGHLGLDGGRYRTQVQTALGTLEYMSPEECTGTAHQRGKTDVYSLGVILYEALAGQLPFSAELGAEVMLMHARRAPVPLHVFSPGLPAALEGLVHAMLAKRPEQRPEMAEVAERLGRVLAAFDRAEAAEQDERTVVMLAPAPSDWDDPGEVTRIAPRCSPELVRLDGNFAADERPRVLAAPCRSTASPTRGEVQPAPPARTASPGVRASTLWSMAAGALSGIGLLIVLAWSPRPAQAPPPAAPLVMCTLGSVPEGARVLGAGDLAVLGRTPWRYARRPAEERLEVVLQHDGHEDMPVALEAGAACPGPIELLPLARNETEKRDLLVQGARDQRRPARGGNGPNRRRVPPRGLEIPPF